MWKVERADEFKRKAVNLAVYKLLTSYSILFPGGSERSPMA